jgi:hypothetical protein
MLYPYFLGLVISVRQQATLDALVKASGQSKSHVVRQLIEEKAPQVGLTAVVNGAGDDDEAACQTNAHGRDPVGAMDSPHA